MSKIAYITGGSKGIGLGIAEEMMKKGMKVAITGRGQAALDSAIAHLNKIGSGEVLGIQSDVRHLEQEQSAVQQVLDT
ncbi:MAG: SDR family NAD(P)-dependent oxidoreductase, partial [Bacteroidota bacterium]